jgi:excisionase family DNA binding protein
MDENLIASTIGPLPFPSFFTLDEIARLLKVKEHEVRRMVRARELAAYLLSDGYRVSTKDFLTWLLIQRASGGLRDERRSRPHHTHH